MGKDNQPKARQAAKLARKKAQRASYDRILIVCEGSKTEPQYLNEIRILHRLHTANVQVRHSEIGTQPLQVVDFAERLFTHGDAAKSVQPRAFEQVYAVFDRDNHATYHAALTKADALNGKLRSDLNQTVQFEAIASVPCFELWLLLHYEEVLAPLHREQVYARLRQHLPQYDKGQPGHFGSTKAYLHLATQRAQHLADLHDAHNEADPYTDFHRLVALLTTLKSG